ncbi:hypothetical protein ACGFNX_42700 [Streptomyces sp. NPDC048723]|uniref:hypothetical protein n=1 Tax=Streptomyces sp. NPDC048723 TaxID=3365589 RepID=UPI003720268A
MSEHTSTPRNVPRNAPVGRRGFLAVAAAMAAAAATPALAGAASAAPPAASAARPNILLTGGLPGVLRPGE